METEHVNEGIEWKQMEMMETLNMETEYYAYETMKKKERTEFLKWYESVKYETFNFREENAQVLQERC